MAEKNDVRKKLLEAPGSIKKGLDPKNRIEGPTSPQKPKSEKQAGA